MQYNAYYCPSTPHGSCYKQWNDICSRRYDKSYSPFALVAFHSRIHMASGVVRCWLSTSSMTRGQRRGLSSNCWLLEHCSTHLGQKRGLSRTCWLLEDCSTHLGQRRAVQYLLAPRALQHSLGAKEGAVQYLLAHHHHHHHGLLRCTHTNDETTFAEQL